MAPYVPEELDVFTVPHSRMKDLVNDYVQMIQKTNFSSVADLELLLDSLQRTFAEFKMHEQIENRLIMKRLKNKLNTLSIRNTLVCNCHKDSHLTDMMVLVREGFAKKTARDRLNYSLQLKKALEDFTEEFLPHMREEEEVFQPMLLEYFSYEELCDLKQKVIEHHLQRDPAVNTVEKGLAEVVEKKECSLSYPDSDKEEVLESKPCEGQQAGFSVLPPEVALNIFSFLNSKELWTCGQVNSVWRELVLDPGLWRELHPVKWANGDWKVSLSQLQEEQEDDCSKQDNERSTLVDDDADVDESEDSEDTDGSDVVLQIRQEARILRWLIKYVLPSAGEGVKVLNLNHCKALTNGLLQRILRMTPNLEYLNISQTRTSDSGLKRLGTNECGAKLHHLNLAGCSNITDATMFRLAAGLSRSSPRARPDTPLCQRENKMVEICDCSTHGSHRTEWFSHSGAVNTSRLCECATVEPDPHRGGCQAASRQSNMLRDNVISREQQVHMNQAMLSTPKVSVVDSKKTCWSCGHPECNVNDQITPNPPAPAPGSVCHLSCQSQENTAEPEPVEDCARPKNTQEVSTNGVVVEVEPSGGHVRNNSTIARSAPSKRVLDCSDSSKDNVDVRRWQCQLEYLNLSGCCQLSDAGVIALAGVGQFVNLTHLDLSGCPALTGVALTSLVSLCPALDHETFFYCDNILDGPYPDTASGCQNLECKNRICCRKGD